MDNFSYIFNLLQNMQDLDKLEIKRQLAYDKLISCGCPPEAVCDLINITADLTEARLSRDILSDAQKGLENISEEDFISILKGILGNETNN